VLIESRHLDQPVERRALAAERERAVGLARHRANTPVQLGSSPAVQRTSARRRGVSLHVEVDVVESHGSFQRRHGLPPAIRC
jgi:hypothetical protein